jgi:hypothetical protein
MPELTHRRARKVTAATGMAATVVAPVPPPVRDAALSPHRPSYARITIHPHAVPRGMRRWALDHRTRPAIAWDDATHPLPRRAGGQR